MISRPLLARGLSLAAFGAIVVTLSCQAIVSSDVPAFTCDGSPESCPAGKYCKGAGCADCETRDVCDGFDNDCNGKVDDGPLSDGDGDGYTVCGSPDPDGMGRIKADCDDTNPKAHPGSLEVCNGFDDDCNGKTDEDGCAYGQVCAGEPKKCVVPCEPQKCAPGQYCDTTSLICVNSTPQPIGAACIANAECDKTKNLSCYSKDTLGDGVIPDPLRGMCTMMCCTSSDCPTDYVCYAPGNGGRYCVDARKLKRGAMGSKTAGTTASAATECRSGVLDNGRCGDTCCNDTQCAPGSRCQFSSADGHNGSFCRGSSAGGGQNSSCFFGGAGDCRSSVCVDFGFPDYNRCVDICCGSDSCGSLAGSPSSCNYFQNQSQNDFVSLCFADHGPGSKGLGQPCNSNNECRSDFCTGPNGYCSDVCCSDADCSKGGAMKCSLISNRPRCVK